MYIDFRKLAMKRSRDFIRRKFRGLGYEIVPAREARRQLNLFGLLLGMSLARAPKYPISVVQVGANDGADELRKIIKATNSRVLLIEPNPELIPLVVANYSGVSGAQVANVAIDPVEGHRDLYVLSGKTRIAFQSLGMSPTGISSFSEEHLIKHLKMFLGRIPKEGITKFSVPTAPLWSVAQSRGFFGAEVIQIDAEGFDLEVLKTANLADWNPAVVQLEVSNLTKEEIVESRELLTALGYKLFDCFPDMIGVLNRRDDPR